MATPIAAAGVRIRGRHPSLAQLVRFCLVGASGYLVNLVVFAGLSATGAHHAVAATGAFLVAVASNYQLNRRWTFRSAGSARRFLAVSVTAFVVALGLLDLLVAAGVPAVIAQAASIVVVTPISFLGNRRWSFGRAERVSPGA